MLDLRIDNEVRPGNYSEKIYKIDKPDKWSCACGYGIAAISKQADFLIPRYVFIIERECVRPLFLARKLSSSSIVFLILKDQMCKQNNHEQKLFWWFLKPTRTWRWRVFAAKHFQLFNLAVRPAHRLAADSAVFTCKHVGIRKWVLPLFCIPSPPLPFSAAFQLRTVSYKFPINLHTVGLCLSWLKRWTSHLTLKKNENKSIIRGYCKTKLTGTSMETMLVRVVQNSTLENRN